MAVIIVIGGLIVVVFSDSDKVGQGIQAVSTLKTLSEIKCYDKDDGINFEVASETAGLMKLRNGLEQYSVKKDGCLNEKVVEYYCDAQYIKVELGVCDAGKTCISGKCQKMSMLKKIVPPRIDPSFLKPKRRVIEKVFIPNNWVVPDIVSPYKESGEECETHVECKSKTCTKPVDQLMDSGSENYCAYISEEIKYWLQSGQQTQANKFINQNLVNFPTQGKTNEEVLKSISKWIHNNIMDNVNLSSTEKGAYTAEDYVSNQIDAQGCTDFGVIFAAFARAKGFPTILVETYSLAYLHELEQGNKPNYIPGHFFANVYFGGEWHVYNPNNNDGVGGTGTFLTPIYNEDCFEDDSLSGPEGCYEFVNSYNENLELDYQKYVVTNKGLDFWDMHGEGSCIVDANTALLGVYGLQ